jgi:hypothetical protein
MFCGYHYENVELPFLNMIYTQCNSKHNSSKDVGIIENFWVEHWHCNGMLYDLYSRNDKYIKFLYL